MICVSLAGISFNDCVQAFQKVEMAEIRLDKMDFNFDQVQRLFSKHKKLIATCRPGEYSEQESRERLLSAIEGGAAYVDVEIEADDDYREEIIERARDFNCKVIISYHDFEKTPGLQQLMTVTNECFEYGAQIAKIVTTVHDKTDIINILSLYNFKDNIVAFGMGKLGKITRLAAPYLGAEFTYASLERGKEVASGQIDFETMDYIFSKLKI